MKDKVAEYITYFRALGEGDKFFNIIYPENMMDYEDNTIQSYETAQTMFHCRVESICFPTPSEQQAYSFGIAGFSERRELIIGHACLLARKLQNVGLYEDAKKLMMHAIELVETHIKITL